MKCGCYGALKPDRLGLSCKANICSDPRNTTMAPPWLCRLNSPRVNAASSTRKIRQTPYCSDVAGLNPGLGVLMKSQKCRNICPGLFEYFHIKSGGLLRKTSQVTLKLNAFIKSCGPSNPEHIWPLCFSFHLSS